MGICKSCIQSRSQDQSERINPTDFTSLSSTSENRPRSRHRLTHTRSYPSQNLNALIDETLLIIRTVVDTDQEPPHAMLLISRMANREDRWLEVMNALIERVPMNDPLGATVIALLLDECSLPSTELLQQLIRRICADTRARLKILQSIIDEHIQRQNKQIEQVTTDSSIAGHQRSLLSDNDEEMDVEETTPTLSNPESKSREKMSKLPSFIGSRSSKRLDSPLAKPIHAFDNHLHRERNTLVVLGCLAEKLVGPTSASMLNTIALEFLIDRVYLGLHGYNQYQSSNQDDEQYSGVMKILLFALIALEKFSHTSESKHILLQSLTITTDSRTMNVLEYYEPWSTSSYCLQRQIGFSARWLLDNIFLLDYRRPTYETIDHRYLNVLLNDRDVSEYLKIGPDGLEARSDTVSFESVRCTYHVNTDVWYYEVLIITEGVMQIGWATKQSKFLNHEGYGIGDDQHSIAYDGCRNLIWFGAKAIPHTNPCWKPGDILGCLLDFDRREVIFSLNGRCLDPFHRLFKNGISDDYFAAASFMSFQHCRFNFGSTPFRYPPKTVTSFKTFNDYGQLSEQDKLILPKYKKLELLRSNHHISDQDCILCVDLPGNTLLKPCEHSGFCEPCAKRLEFCPICRSEIRERLIS